VDLLAYPFMVAAILIPALWLLRRHDPVEALSLGAAIGIAAWAALALARFFAILPAGTPKVVGAVTLAVSLIGAMVMAIRAVARPDRQVARPPTGTLLLAVAGVALATLGVEAIMPHYGIAMLYWDWWEHFDLAHFYLDPHAFTRSYGDGSTITSRTPLFNLLGSMALGLLGDRFTIFQVLTAAVGWLWALPAALIARRLLGARSTGLVAMLGLSPLILFCTAYAWPKGLVLFFALLALDRFLALRESSGPAAHAIALQLGLSSGLTIMTHAGFIGYLLPLYGLLLRDTVRRRRGWSAVFESCAMGALVALPWYAWAIAQYGLREGLLGYPQPASASVALWLIDHVVILASSLLPVSLFLYRFIPPAQNVLIAYLGSAMGLLGVVFLVRTLARSTRGLRLADSDRGVITTVAAFAGGGVLVATLLINGWGNGWAAAQAVFLPALIGLTLIAMRVMTATRGLVLAALVECGAVVGLGLAYMWSPAATSEPNAVLAAAEHVRFLGQQTWPLGVLILLAGATVISRVAFSLVGSQPARLQPKPRSSTLDAA
jgi:hypothetical protein